MFFVHKISSHSAVDFAAEELKKYLRMMMPEGGDVQISYAPAAKDGFRLGLMTEFGLDVSDAEDLALDDILYIDCDTKGGIIAGSNPRSVLLAVYEYFRQNGCRWLFPGVDGEYIPMRDIVPVKYRHMADMRIRGWCNEGAEYQQSMLEAIDFVPKVGMNVFMMEFRVPVPYYNSYYRHKWNVENRPEEPVSDRQILQWKRQCEAEIARRGLQFHDIGHGWTADPFGIDSSLREWMGDNEKHVSDDARQYIAMMNGERKLYRNRPNFTNFCMSNPAAQQKFAKYVADYAENHSNSDYLHVWLADLANNHCECENCRKKNPSDWYVILLNMVDEELTRRNMDTRIVFIVYVDTSWPPETEKILHQDRFTLMLAPISRDYTVALPPEGVHSGMKPYERNKLKLPGSLEEYFAYLNGWKKMWKGTSIAYEYHFYHHQCYDLGGLEYAKRVNEDIRVYHEYGVSGLIEDGSQRSFFPTGLPFYTYARTLYDVSLTPEEIAEDYCRCAFGDAWREFRDYLRKLSDTFDFYYLKGKRSANPKVSVRYNPEMAARFRAFGELKEEGMALIREHYNLPARIGTVSVRLLEYGLEFAEMMAAALAEKAVGHDEKASELYERLRLEFGKKEVDIERYYDQFNFFYAYNGYFASKSNLSEPLIAITEE